MSLIRWLVILSLLTPYAHCAVPLELDVNVARSGVAVSQGASERVHFAWKDEDGNPLRLRLNLADETALIEHLGDDSTSFISNASPVFMLTVGSRDMDPRRGWIRFFDKVHKRPYRQYRAQLQVRSGKVTTDGRSASITLDGLSGGEFSGSLRFTVYAGSRLVHVQALLSTKEDRRAIVYDAGLVSSDNGWKRTAFIDSKDEWRRRDSSSPASTIAVRHRTLIAQTGAGAVAVFAPPHQYFYPLDFADNFAFTWQGKGYRDLVPESGLGIRQPLNGDNRFVPWFNAPPGTQQRLSFFLLPEKNAESAMREVKRFTRGDKFEPLPGYKTFTSHYHVEHSLDVIQNKVADPAKDPRLKNPGFKQVFKRMGVDIVHLAEFHRGRTPRLKTAERLSQLKVMHDECARLSESDFLLLPGEEPNVHLGGHWISFFPKPVYWVLNRGRSEPFVEQREGFGKVYHVGSSADVLRLFELENGLNWTAHARIKSSTGYPDGYRHRNHFKSDRFLGAAWKAMPADLSRERLGERVLDLLDDMSNWGEPKYVMGEVDVFKIQPDYELWGHMNINYLKLNQVPRYEDGWQPVLDVLRKGNFFVTTGEILIPEFQINGSRMGETLQLKGDRKVKLSASAEWTFPLASAYVISGDGKEVYRRRISLREHPAFGQDTFELDVDLRDRNWVRFELWDIAGNGAFTQPMWGR